ncbi:hypothetical protein SCOCK_330077 [Actinacidiphila cocklensis]|uniref:Uncharacterized protein n=1 Tax=Actinacidiphila cocklensis TaxID=887465 RepID=A0A9W4DSU0_9ACTN|nr:hypothetical protein SCOCK_330077 [Actinacidiphila cocklensis]
MRWAIAFPPRPVARAVPPPNFAWGHPHAPLKNGHPLRGGHPCQVRRRTQAAGNCAPSHDGAADEHRTARGRT